MLSPVMFYNDDDGNDGNEDDGGGHRQHHDGGNNQAIHDVEFAARPVFIKVKNCILVLGLLVATFLQYYTLEPTYLQTILLWRERGQSQEEGVQTNEDCQCDIPDDYYASDLAIYNASGYCCYRTTNDRSNLSEGYQDYLPDFLVSIFLRMCQSLLGVGVLVFLRTTVFSSHSRLATTLEAVLSDLLFHMQCRFVVGFLSVALISLLPMPIPFCVMEAAVVTLSIALQTTVTVP